MMPLLYFAVILLAFFLVLRLTCGDCVMGNRTGSGPARLPIIPMGWALSLFLVLTYLACVAFDLLLPGYAMYETWAGLLPGFVWLTPAGFFIGLVEVFLYGWYVALIFGGLFNVLSNRTVQA